MSVVNEMYREQVPQVTFKTRIQKDDGEYTWRDKSTDEYFKNKTVVLFSLPGAFTPACTETHLPGYEIKYKELLEYVDDVYCVSVNDAFVMNSWADYLEIENVKLIPDGNAHFTKKMGMLVNKEHLGFGQRSWRYMAVINDGIVEKWWQEPGINNSGSDDDPYVETTPENSLKYLSASK